MAEETLKYNVQFDRQALANELAGIRSEIDQALSSSVSGAMGGVNVSDFMSLPQIGEGMSNLRTDVSAGISRARQDGHFIQSIIQNRAEKGDPFLEGPTGFTGTIKGLFGAGRDSRLSGMSRDE